MAKEYSPQFWVPKADKTVLPNKTSRAKTPDVRKRKAAPRQVDRNNWTRRRIDYQAIEAAKVLVDALPYRRWKRSGKLQELRINLMPWSKSGYIDIRMYVDGKSTGRGVLIHLDHLVGLTAAVLKADKMMLELVRQGIIEMPKTPDV